MSLLADFIVALNENWVQLLKPEELRGKEQEVLLLFLQQRKAGSVDKIAVQKSLQLSTAHFDKICSLLLHKCYAMVAPTGGLDLLNLLSAKLPTLEKHFFRELDQQLATYKTDCRHLCSILELMQNNLPIATQNHELLVSIHQAIQAAVPTTEQINMQVYFEAKQLYLLIAKDFASRKITATKELHLQKLVQLEACTKRLSDQAKAELLRTRVYYHFACLEMEDCIAPALAALAIYKAGKFVYAKENYLRMQLRLAEVYYFQSEFTKAYLLFKEAFQQQAFVPDRGYFNTKYIQLCLIEGHLAEAEEVFNAQMKNITSKKMYITRDIISGIKVAMFNGRLEDAHELILLGYEAQSKMRYMQYEVELRNLEVAYFFLSKNTDVALQLCERNVKYLHKNGLNIKKSRYSEFFLLTQAFHRRNKLTQRQQTMLNNWQAEG